MAELKSELSKKNPWWISKHRYYELKHFCLQYHEFERSYRELEARIKQANDIVRVGYGVRDDREAENLAVKMADFQRAIKLIEKVALGTDSEIGVYIFQAVTEGLSFTQLKMMLDIPCERDMYYDRYRKFFWLLSQEKGI